MGENTETLEFIKLCIRSFVSGDAASTSLYALHSSLLWEALSNEQPNTSPITISCILNH